MKKVLLSTLMAGCLFLANVGAAFADLTPSLSVDDVTLEGESADAVYSNPADKNTSGDGSELNDYPGFSGDEFAFIAKAEGSSGYSGSGKMKDIDIAFTLAYAGTTADDFSTGTWTLSWAGSDLPATLDFVLGLKSATSVAYYFFDNVFLSDTDLNAAGTYAVKFAVNRNEYKDLSHMSLYGRLGDPVPEPATMLLFGTGIAGLAGIARRKRN